MTSPPIAELGLAKGAKGVNDQYEVRMVRWRFAMISYKPPGLEDESVCVPSWRIVGLSMVGMQEPGTPSAMFKCRWQSTLSSPAADPPFE
ncbi:MAG: hypothetical protein OXG37_09435 [Actinomycetia bacterium]|nr:hypothetical protein [Actinomycetes bacterium]